MAEKKRLPKRNVDFDEALDDIELKTDNQSVTLTAGKRVEDAISSGSLVYDLITGGGFPPGRIVLLVGPEQSGKSTFVYNAMANAESKGIRTFMGDAEGSTDPNYLENIMKQYGLSIVDLFGIKDENGKYIQKPTLRHYQPEIGEQWFRLIRRTLKLLPDRIKRRVGKDTKWFDCWSDGEEEREDGKVQTLWFLDSLPSLMPEDLDEDDESTPMAQQARMYSNEFRGLPGRLAKKRSTYICVNQLREKPMVMYGCFFYKAPVRLADGTTMHIGKIVSQKLPVEVLSRNPETGNYEAKRVVGWFNNGNAEPGDFLKFTVRAGNKSGYSYVSTTANHLLMDFDTKEMRHACDFKVGDRFVTTEEYRPFHSDQWQLIYGSMLGDGNVRSQGHKAQLRFSHGKSQTFYLRWKHDMLKVFSHEIYLNKAGGESFDTSFIPNKRLVRIAEETNIDEGLRTFSGVSGIVRDRIDLRGLAIWYQDDGTFNIGKEGAWECLISCKRFSEEERDHLIKRIAVLTSVVFKLCSNGIRLNDKGAIKKFHQLISPYMLPGFEYKVYDIDECEDYGSYKWRRTSRSVVLRDAPAEILEIGEQKLYPGMSRGKFDLEIEDNHNYIVGDCVVHNSPQYEPCGNAPKHYCFTKDTILFTNKGVLTAEQVFLDQPGKLLGLKGIEKYNSFKYLGKHPSFTIEADYGFCLQGRSNHHVYTVREGSSVMKWTALKDITHYDYIPIKLGADVWADQPPVLDYVYNKSYMENKTLPYKISYPKKVSKQLARLAGYFLAEGYVKDGKFDFVMFDKDVMDDFKKCFKYVFKVNDTFIKKHLILKGNRFTCDSPQVFQFLDYLGLADKPSREKEVPWFILQSPKTFVKEFLSALFEGDGSPDKDKALISYSSSSRKLVKQVHLLLLNFGIFSDMFNYHSTWYSKQDPKSRYGGINITSSNYFKFYAMIGFIGKRKTERFQNFPTNGREVFDYLPKFMRYRKTKSNLYRILNTLNNNKCEGFKLSLFSKENVASVRTEIKKFRTSHERESATKEFDSILRLVDYTRDNNIVWVRVNKIKRSSEPLEMYDGDMPKTHTIVTNGIISHNSSQRIQFQACSFSNVTIPTKESGPTLKEESWNGEGEDGYKLVKLTVVKNKLFSPYKISYVRLWYTSADGVGYGIDPVFDTAMFLVETGQMKKKAGGRFHIYSEHLKMDKVFTWKQFKAFILNPSGKGRKFRKRCFDQIRSGTAFDLYFQDLVNRNKKKKKSDADDE